MSSHVITTEVVHTKTVTYAVAEEAGKECDCLFLINIGLGGSVGFGMLYPMGVICGKVLHDRSKLFQWWVGNDKASHICWLEESRVQKTDGDNVESFLLSEAAVDLGIPKGCTVEICCQGNGIMVNWVRIDELIPSMDENWLVAAGASLARWGVRKGIKVALIVAGEEAVREGGGGRLVGYRVRSTGEGVICSLEYVVVTAEAAGKVGFLGGTRV